MTRYAMLMDIARRTRRKLDATPAGSRRYYQMGRLDALAEVATDIFDVPPDVFAASVEDKPAPETNYLKEDMNNEKQ